MNIAGPLFEALKVAWTDAKLLALFPGNFVVGQRLHPPTAWPALQPWPTKERVEIISNAGGYFDFVFEVGIVSNKFEQATDWRLSKALKEATIGITVNGPITLGDSGVRLIGIINVPEGADYVEQPPDLFICNVLFRAKASY